MDDSFGIKKVVALKKIEQKWRAEADDAAWIWQMLFGLLPSETAVSQGKQIQATLLTKLLQEPFDPSPAGKVSVQLAKQLQGDFQKLARLQSLLTNHLLNGLTTEEVALITPRLITLWNALAAGFGTTVCTQIEQTHQAEVDALQAAAGTAQSADEQFQALFQASFTPMLLHENGTIHQINLAFSATFGYHPDDVVGNSIDTLIDPQDQERIAQYVKIQFEQPYRATILHADGTPMPIQVVARHIALANSDLRLVFYRSEMNGFDLVEPDAVALTSRQTQILCHIANGKKYAEIANAFGLSLSGVKYHIGRIYDQIGVENRTEASAWYWQQFGDPEEEVKEPQPTQ